MRITGHHLSRGLQARVGFGADVAGRTLDASRTAVGQYRLAEQIRRFDPGLVERLPAGLQRWLGAFTARHGDAGRRLATDGGTDVRALLRGTEVLDEATSSRLVRAYDRGSIDADDVRRVTRGLRDDQIDQRAVRDALDTIRWIEQREIADTSRIQVGSTANSRNPYYTVRYNPEFDRDDLVDGEVPDRFRPGGEHGFGPDDNLLGYQPPHQSDGLVVEAELTATRTYIRAHREGSQIGPFMIPADEFREVARDGARALEREYALPGGTPGYVTEVTLPPGETVRISTVGRLSDDLPGGGTQIEVRRYPGEIPEEWFPPESRTLDEFLEAIDG